MIQKAFGGISFLIEIAGVPVSGKMYFIDPSVSFGPCYNCRQTPLLCLASIFPAP
jgi:hypothetical protein